MPRDLQAEIRAGAEGRLSFEEAWPAIDAIPGWLSPGQERCLYDLAAGLPNDGRILEIGCYLGRSSAAIASACRGTSKHIFCMDTFCGNDSDFVNGENSISWEGDDFFGVYDANLRKAGLRSFVTPLRGMSHDLVACWCEPLDMLFIDAGHEYEDVLRDVELYFPFVKQGGIVALHDVTPGWPGVYRVWNEHAKPLLVEHGARGSLAYGTKRG